MEPNERPSLKEIMMIRKRHLIAPALLGFCLLPLPSCAPPSTGAAAYAQVAAPAPGTARVWFVRTKDPDEQFGDPIISGRSERAGDRLLSRFPAGHLCLHGAELRYAHRCEGRAPARARDADLSRGVVGRQLAGGHRRGRNLFCANVGTIVGAGLRRHADRSGSAPGLVAGQEA